MKAKLLFSLFFCSLLSILLSRLSISIGAFFRPL